MTMQVGKQTLFHSPKICKLLIILLLQIGKFLQNNAQLCLKKAYMLWFFKQFNFLYKFELNYLCFTCKVKSMYFRICGSFKSAKKNWVRKSQTTNKPHITKKIGVCKWQIRKVPCFKKVHKVPHLRKVHNLTNYLSPKFFGFAICGPPTFAKHTLGAKVPASGTKRNEVKNKWHKVDP